MLSDGCINIPKITVCRFLGSRFVTKSFYQIKEMARYYNDIVDFKSNQCY